VVPAPRSGHLGLGPCSAPEAPWDLCDGPAPDMPPLEICIQLAGGGHSQRRLLQIRGNSLPSFCLRSSPLPFPAELLWGHTRTQEAVAFHVVKYPISDQGPPTALRRNSGCGWRVQLSRKVCVRTGSPRSVGFLLPLGVPPCREPLLALVAVSDALCRPRLSPLPAC
jgi:hypothetical protein